MYKIQTQFSFEAAHRLYNVNTYSSECRENVHGHSYKVTVVVGRRELNDAGMVMDFKLLKTVLRELEETYDHSCILVDSDPLVDIMTDNCKKVLKVSQNPTAEWMSWMFASCIESKLLDVDPEVKVLSVAVQETENNIAIWEED